MRCDKHNYLLKLFAYMLYALSAQPSVVARSGTCKIRWRISHGRGNFPLSLLSRWFQEEQFLSNMPPAKQELISQRSELVWKFLVCSGSDVGMSERDSYPKLRKHIFERGITCYFPHNQLPETIKRLEKIEEFKRRQVFSTAVYFLLSVWIHVLLESSITVLFIIIIIYILLVVIKCYETRY
jgi:hypothetical protein